VGMLLALPGIVTAALLTQYAGIHIGSLDASIGRWAPLVPEGAVVIALGIRAALVNRESRAWACIAVGVTLWVAGDTYYRVALFGDSSVPTPSAADLMFLGSYPFLYAGLVQLVRGRAGRRLPATMWIDVAISSFAVAALTQGPLFAAVVANTGATALAAVTTLAYPLVDVLMVALVVSSGGITGWRGDRRWAVLAAGLVTFAVTDTVYTNLVTLGLFQPGTVLELGWVVGLALIGWAAWCPGSSAPRAPRPARGRAAVLPLVLGVVAIACGLVDDYIGGGVMGRVFALGCLFALTARVAVTAKQNRQMLRRVEETSAAAERARQDAELANGAKSEFLSRMSHELRTPLNSILGFSQLLEMDDLRPDQRDGVGHIIKGGRHLLELIDEILDISRIEAGRMRLSIEPVAVTPIVAEAVGMVDPLAAARGVTLAVSASDAGGVYAMADQQRLKQVLLNLLSNAIKYNHENGSVAVTCSVTAAGRVRITVADSGWGIASECLEGVFEPFERLGAEQTQVPGTGLGLALSRRLCETMGGTLDVESEPGVGSEFTIELALAEPGQAVLEPDPHADDDAPSPLGFDRPQRVLYIEDNVANIELIERVLGRRPGFELTATLQGSLGIEFAREQQPDLVLLDLHLPDVHGHGVLAQLKDDPKTAEIPVIVLTADISPGSEQQLRDLGAASLVPKPIDVAAFLEAVDDALALTAVTAR
jgi:signal transduction histidine kinase/CheY-like chemotaxis protein